MMLDLLGSNLMVAVGTKARFTASTFWLLAGGTVDFWVILKSRRGSEIRSLEGITPQSAGSSCGRAKKSLKKF